ncbi:MAG TPA: hypothetical protein VJ974_09515 [Geopsychrobacteraceae bacterium]|nr:hypothetical protein [Geopsychrobacteraceae bacterium]
MPSEIHIDSSADSRAISDGFAEICISQLGGVAQDLEGLAGRAERQFLAIGSQLQGMYQRASTVSKQAAEVFDMMLGEQAEDIRLNLQSLLGRLGEHLKHVLRKADQGNRTLGELLNLLEQLPEPLTGYREISKTLQMLGISTRIETGTEGSAEGFQLLGSELKNLELAIGDKVDRIMTRLDSLDSLCRKARARVISIESRRSSLISQGEDLTRSVLSAVEEKNRLAAETTRTLSNRSNEITASIGEIVTSLQYQDITRQQLEHVQISLKEISDELGKTRASESFERGPEVMKIVAEVCRIQSAQLTHSHDELDAAIRRIFDSLNDVSGTVTAIAVDMQEAAGATERDGGTVFSELEEAIRKISGTLSQEIETTREAERAIGSVLGEATEMSEMVNEINRVGLEMKVIALNAGINATNVGGGLPSLEVIAGGTQQLSKRVFSQTEALAAGLGELISSSRRLNDASLGATEDDTMNQLQELSQEASDLLLRLQQLYDDIVVRLCDMESSSRTLAADIAEIASVFNIHTDSRQTINGAVEVMTQIAHQIGEPVTAGRDVEDGYLQTLRERFTMQSERDIFNNVQSNDQRSDEETVSENDFGANVEFF